VSDQPPPSGHVVGIVDRVLRFMDAPWKAVTIVVLILVIGVGWIAWEKRAELLEAWLTPDTPELKTDAIPEALDRLTVETDADLVQIWAVNLGTNSQWFLGARRHDGERPVIPSPRRLPIVVHASDVKALVQVMDGSPSCVDLSETGSPLARRLKERGMKRGCAVPIPPGPESFVGVIYLAWITPVDVQTEGVAIGAAREIARKLATN
jgi:hypothetical protein